MNRHQYIQTAEQILRTRREAILRTVHSELELLRNTDTSEVRDPIDKAVDDEFDSIASGLAEIESRELERIEHALSQIQTGQYGLCEQCNRRIPLARLKVIPWATKCVQCQHNSDTRHSLKRYAERWDQIADENSDQTERFAFRVAATW